MKKNYMNQKFLFILNIFCFITYFVKAEKIEFRIKIKPGNQKVINLFNPVNDVGIYLEDGYRETGFNSEMYSTNLLTKEEYKVIADFAGEIKTLSEVFSDLPNLVEFELLEFNNSQLTDISKMFKNCNSLKSVNISMLKAETLIDASQLFQDCISLETVYMPDVITSSVKDMSYMFSGCNNLTSIDLNKFGTSGVTNMSGIFENCEFLESIDVSNLDTSSVIDMSYMFKGCESLTSLDLTNFKTSKVTKMTGMFEACTDIVTLNISNFDTSSVTDMSYMFSGCINLESLDLSKFDTSNVQNMFSMFSSCASLYDLDLSTFETQKLNDISYMFYDTKIVILDLGNFNTSNIKEMRDTFNQSLDLGYLSIKPYDGKDIFGTVMKENLTICVDNSKTEESEYQALIDLNAINNCSDYCFYEFYYFINNRTSCKLDCSKINENNPYYHLCGITLNIKIKVNDTGYQYILNNQFIKIIF